MSIRLGSQPQFPIRKLSGGITAPWVRPADWPALPAVVPTEQKFVGLIAVQDTTSEYLSLLFQGAYTVDWGDGTALENVATNTKASHSYTYATLSSAVTSRGYKTVVITITPQSGQNLTLINLQQKHASSGSAAVYSQWLDITISAPYCTSVTIGGVTVIAALLERCNIIAIGPITDGTSFFQYCYSLQSVPLFNLSAMTNGTNFFYACSSLQLVPLFNLSAMTNGTCFFFYCSSIQSVPALNFAAVTVADAIFSSTGNLARSLITGFGINHSYANCNLSATALNEIFANLPSVSSKTITITGNPGAATCAQSIATNKGWTVTN